MKGDQEIKQLSLSTLSPKTIKKANLHLNKSQNKKFKTFPEN